MTKQLGILALAIALSTGTKSYAQGITPHDMEKLQIMEDSMMITVDSMYEAFIPDTRIGYSERFIRQLVRTLKIPNSYAFPFNKLKEKINMISPDDNSFRIFNWGVTWNELGRRYYGAVQLPQEKLKLFGLIDYSEKLNKGAEDSVLTNGKWFGAIYYNVITTEAEGHKVYNLFGFSGASALSNKKVIDPLTITDSTITFGAPVFGIGSKNFPKQRINRFILEYKKGVQVSMNYDKEKQVIIFDNLTSQVNDPTRKFTYVPSGQYDGFRWNNEMWNYLNNLIPVTELKDGQAPNDEEGK